MLELIKDRYGTLLLFKNPPGLEEPIPLTAEVYKNYKRREDDESEVDEFEPNPKILGIWNDNENTRKFKAWFIDKV